MKTERHRLDDAFHLIAACPCYASHSAAVAFYKHRPTLPKRFEIFYAPHTAKTIVTTRWPRPLAI